MIYVQIMYDVSVMHKYITQEELVGIQSFMGKHLVFDDQQLFIHVQRARTYRNRLQMFPPCFSST